MRRLTMATSSLKKIINPYPVQDMSSTPVINSNKQSPFCDRTYIMGVINITADSFSGDGLLKTGEVIDRSIRLAKRFIDAKADILDIGGESTRPGATPVSEEEELSRIIPVIKAIRNRFTKIMISVDTLKANVAEQAIAAGANMINDVSGLTADPKMVTTVARLNCPVVIMHSRLADMVEQTEIGGRYINENNMDITEEVVQDLEKLTIFAISKGIKPQNIIIDPGIGFGKSTEQNLAMLKNLGNFKKLDFPMLIGVSRKSCIGYTLQASVNQRLFGSLAATSVAIMNGANIIRTHDVKETAQAARIVDEIIAA